jgi:hypothetical protein
VLFLLAPTVISMIEKNHDVSVFFDVNEEENKESESSKNLEIVVVHTENYKHLLLFSNSSKNKFYYNTSHYQFHTECISPPPEFS